jgi:adenylate cyclase class 2
LAATGVETEIKLRVEAAGPARTALEGIGARLLHARYFEDNVVLDDASGGLLAAGLLLRVRRTEHGCVLTFKGPRRIHEGIRSRPEHETAVEDPEALDRILGGLGLVPRFRYQKYRESYAWQDAEIVVDETPIGVFLEIEGPPDTIRAAALALGRTPAEFIADSYAALFFAGGGSGDMTFR